MKRAGFAVLLGVVAGCSSGRGMTEDGVEYQKVRLENQADHLVIEPPDGGRLQFVAWAIFEDAAIGGWTSSRGDAESRGQEFGRKHPDREWTVLWREKPSEVLVPKSQ